LPIFERKPSLRVGTSSLLLLLLLLLLLELRRLKGEEGESKAEDNEEEEEEEEEEEATKVGSLLKTGRAPASRRARSHFSRSSVVSEFNS
jgi:hypothetical protein